MKDRVVNSRVPQLDLPYLPSAPDTQYWKMNTSLQVIIATPSFSRGQDLYIRVSGFPDPLEFV